MTPQIEVKQAQPRVGQGAVERHNYGSNRHGYGNNNFAGGGGGGTPFDPAQLATLYQRMYQLTGVNQGQGNWGAMGSAAGGAMNPMMGMGGMGAAWVAA
jgi:hypothetical protein